MTGRYPGVAGSNNPLGQVNGLKVNGKTATAKPLVQDKRTTHCLMAGATIKADGSINGKIASGFGLSQKELPLPVILFTDAKSVNGKIVSKKRS